MEPPGHVPVLLSEVLALLAPRPGDVAVDCTLGPGGHAAALAEAVGPGGVVVGLDLDPGSIAAASARLADCEARFEAVRGSFVRLPRVLAERGLRADVVLADLGFSSAQMDDPERGMSFSAEGPLDMRLDPEGRTTAADLLASLSAAELTRLIRDLGEEPMAAKIAQIVVRNRDEQPIQTTAQLARLVREAYGRRAHASRLHPATRTFMALRIAVNDELGALHGLLDELVAAAGRIQDDGWLQPGARVGVISFHSLEDRAVKRAFAGLVGRGLAEHLARGAVTATDEEVRANPRSRSAKLRAVRMTSPVNSSPEKGQPPDEPR